MNHLSDWNRQLGGLNFLKPCRLSIYDPPRSPTRYFMISKKKSDFLPKKSSEKIENGWFFKKYVSGQNDSFAPRYTLMGPQTPIFPILSAHLPPPISNFEIFENRPQNNIFHDFFKKSLKYLSDHLSDVLKWKYGPSAFQRTFSHEKILKTRQDTPFWSHVPKGCTGLYYNFKT